MSPSLTTARLQPRSRPSVRFRLTASLQARKRGRTVPRTLKNSHPYGHIADIQKTGARDELQVTAGGRDRSDAQRLNDPAVYLMHMPGNGGGASIYSPGCQRLLPELLSIDDIRCIWVPILPKLRQAKGASFGGLFM